MTNNLVLFAILFFIYYLGNLGRLGLIGGFPPLLAGGVALGLFVGGTPFGLIAGFGVALGLLVKLGATFGLLVGVAFG